MMETDWPALVRNFGPMVWKTAYRLLRNEADASDCFQETFLAALNFSRRQRVSSWAGLLQRIATARALDQLRRRGRDRSVADTQLLDQHACSNPGPAEEARADELGERLRTALAHLPPQQAQAFCLRNLNGMDYREVAMEMGITVDAAGALLHRAREKLAELLIGAATVDLKRR